MAIAIRGDVLRRELARRGLRQADFARKVGIPPQTLADACKGRGISGTTLSKILNTLMTIKPLPLADEILSKEPPVPRKPKIDTKVGVENTNGGNESANASAKEC